MDNDFSSDFSSYQTAETAWRYDVRVAGLQQQIQHVEKELRRMKSELQHLLDHPPRYDLFNWSA